MNRQTKAYSILLYILWPFSAILIGIKKFDLKFGRRLLVAAFVFMGYTAGEPGDLERYASQYYTAADSDFNELFELLLNLQVGKFFNDITAIAFSGFNNHHIYFAFLFGVFGYFLVNAIHLVYIKDSNKVKIPILIGFIAFGLFYSVAALHNYAFYMGGIYFLYFLLKIVLDEEKKKNHALIFLTPLFHIGLLPLLIVPVFFTIVKQKTIWYIVLLILSITLSQTFLINKLEANLYGTETILDTKIKTYALGDGRERLEQRYEAGYEAGNFNYRILRDSRTWTNTIGVPLLLIFLLLNYKKIKQEKENLDLLNISIASLSVTMLMLNISQGERFYLISGFMILAAYVYGIQKNNFSSFKYRFLLYVSLPIIVLANFVYLILAKNITTADFYLSNFPLKLIELF